MSKTNRRVLIHKLVYSAMFLAIALLLPFLTGHIPEIGQLLCPMHLPILLCGFICGMEYGAAVGFVAPILRNLLFGMPKIPTAFAMMFELAAYGFFAALFYKILPKKPIFVYISLILSMIAGRLVNGAANLVIYGVQSSAYTLSMFWTGSFVNTIPGIIVQIVLIPPIFLALKHAKLIPAK